MEYFKYDYKNVNREINFTNYETFISNMKMYKYYLFDLSLIQYDPKVDLKVRNKTKFVIYKQKFFFVLPYLVILPMILIYKKRNFFSTKMLHREFRFISSLFGGLLGVRILQKGLLKYDGDNILIDLAKNKSHSL